MYIPKGDETLRIASCDTVTATSLVWTAGWTGNIRSLVINIVVPRESDAPATPAPSLSTGIKAAIGVSAALACIIVLIAGFLLARRQRRKTRKLKGNMVDSKPGEQRRNNVYEVEAGTRVIKPSELKGEEFMSKEAAELSGSLIAELPDNQMPTKEKQPPLIEKSSSDKENTIC